jgi:predicted amidohydrolase
VQPPIAPGAITSTDTGAMLTAARELLAEAGQQRCDAVCLPEMLNVFGLEPDDALSAAAPEMVEAFLDEMAAFAKRWGFWLICPVLERRGQSVYNASHVFDPTGERRGWYDKVHLTDDERDAFGTTAGQTYPIFEASWGRFGIMTCHDSYFPEVAQILALDGADVIFFPSWQSGPSEIAVEIQWRARAIDQCVIIVRSSFGFEPDVAWRPGMFFGRSCVIDRDGTVIADAGHSSGLAIASVDVAKPRLMDVVDGGGDVRDLRKMLQRHRAPWTYARLTERAE